MIIETWGELVSRLDTALAFAQDDLGLDTAGTRFCLYRTCIATLETIRVEKGDGAAFEHFRSDIEPNAVAFSESQELTMVVPFLRSIPPARASKKLQVVLKGPELPSDEDENSNHARNTMFELNLAARLQRAGFSVDVTEDADLDFTCNGVRWFGECKRPYKTGTIAKNMSIACQQLGKRLSASSLAARGLLAISISRPLTTKAPVLEHASEEELRASLRGHVGNMVKVMQEEMAGIERCRETRGGLGLLVAHLIMPGWNTQRRMPVGIQYSAGTDIGTDGRGDGDRLWDIIKRTFTP
jgi:hypothetical protein